MSKDALSFLTAGWFRALRDQWRLLAAALPAVGDAFDRDDLPVSFILQRDSYEAGERRRRRHGSPDLVRKKIGRMPAVHMVDHRADARSTLRANADGRRHGLDA